MNKSIQIFRLQFLGLLLTYNSLNLFFIICIGMPMHNVTPNKVYLHNFTLGFYGPTAENCQCKNPYIPAKQMSLVVEENDSSESQYSDE